MICSRELTMSPAIATDPGKFYVWRASDDFAIHLNIKLVTRLNAQVARAANRGGSGELQGILLGRGIDAPFRATVVEDFQLLEPADGRTGGLALGDLEAALHAQGTSEQGPGQKVVGFFRARRDGRLNLNPEDLGALSKLFNAAGNVALLIQTSRGHESDAALFYSDSGDVRPRDFGFGFPFDAEHLANGHPGWRYPDPIDHSPVASAVTAAAAASQAQGDAAPPMPLPRISDFTMPPPPLPPPAESGIHWGRLAPTVLLAGLAIATIQFAANHGSAPPAAPPEAPAAEATSPANASADASAAPADDARLGLNVKALPHQLEIRWNRQSGTITASDKGEMKITEEGITESVPFDQAQLHDGYVAYTPKTNDVSIRLEVTGKDGVTTSESVRTVAIP
jgi:hypothetical protein